MIINHVYRPVDPSLVLHIDGQGSRRLDNKVSDLSGNKNHGTIFGAVYKNSPNGKSVLSFDGVDDYVNCENRSSLNITKGITLGAWIKIPTTDGTSNRGIISKFEGTNPANNRSYALYIDCQTQNNVPKAALVVSSLGTNASAVSVVGTTTLNANRWYHIVGVFAPNTAINIYLDGILDNTNTTNIPSSLFVSSVPVKVGNQYANSSIYYLSGSIADIRIYNRDWLSSEISKWYNETRMVYGK